MHAHVQTSICITYVPEFVLFPLAELLFSFSLQLKQYSVYDNLLLLQTTTVITTTIKTIAMIKAMAMMNIKGLPPPTVTSTIKITTTTTKKKHS